MKSDAINEASIKACNKIREVFAEAIKIHPGANPKNLKKGIKPLDFLDDNILIDEFTDEWTWYMQGYKDAYEKLSKND